MPEPRSTAWQTDGRVSTPAGSLSRFHCSPFGVPPPRVSAFGRRPRNAIVVGAASGIPLTVGGVCLLAIISGVGAYAGDPLFIGLSLRYSFRTFHLERDEERRCLSLAFGEALAAVFLYQGVSWRGNPSVRSLR